MDSKLEILSKIIWPKINETILVSPKLILVLKLTQTGYSNTPTSTFELANSYHLKK